MGIRVHNVPEDYQDLYELYFDPSHDSFVRGLTRRYAGTKVPDSDIEDLMHSTFERMLRLKHLEKFDAERGNFGLFLQQIVRSVVYNWHALNSRTPTSLGQGGREGDKRGRPASSDGGGSPEELVLQGMRSEDPDPEQGAAYSEMVRRLVETAEDAGRLENPTARDTSLVTLLRLLASGAEAKEAAAELGVSPSTITHWRRHLREVAVA